MKRCNLHIMIRTIQLLFLALLNSLLVAAQETPVPKHYSIVDSLSGDLDNDGVNELVVAYNTKEDNENEGLPLELIIYKKTNENWEAWKSSTQALYGSRDGGMMGDPFEGIEVNKGILEMEKTASEQTRREVRGL